MAARRNIRRKYGTLKVYEKSLVLQNICMFITTDPEKIPDLIPKLDAMLDEVYTQGREDEREFIGKKYKEFTSFMKNLTP